MSVGEVIIAEGGGVVSDAVAISYFGRDFVFGVVGVGCSAGSESSSRSIS